jgi:hypothetical protein
MPAADALIEPRRCPWILEARHDRIAFGDSRTPRFKDHEVILDGNTSIAGHDRTNHAMRVAGT